MSKGFFGRFSRRGPAAEAPAAPARPPESGGYGYFDEAYFQRGWERGTAYCDYLRGARSSLLNAEIAAACAALRPRRVLEIGCATGVIVAHLNRMGVETHGIDVSQWAVDHREDPRVVLSGAESLPFPDGGFDLVYSVHALEHLPEAVADAAFAEIARVSAPDALQFHTLPILGLGPYGGDRAAAIAGLRKDPTHHLLQDEAWWLARFESIGFADAGVRLLFQREDRSDLSISQLLMARPDGGEPLRAKVKAWNERVIAGCAASALAARQGILRPLTDAASSWLALPGAWNDIHIDTDFIIDDETVFTAEVAFDADAPAVLRFCFLSGEGDEFDFIRAYEPGVTTFQFRRGDMLQRLGSVRRVREVVFGGEGRGRVRASLVAEKSGVALFAM